MKIKWFVGITILLCIIASVSVSGTFAAPSATITVNTTTDELNNDGDCSLREAIRSVNLNTSVDACTGGGTPVTIVLQSNATYTLTIAGQDENAALTGDLDITHAVTITGNNAIVQAGTTTTNGIDQVFDVFNTPSVTISDVTIRHGRKGGINLTGVGHLKLVDSTVTLNTEPNGSGGGISGSGPNTIIELENVTVSNNAANLTGGGISSQGIVTLKNSTITGNKADSDGGGIFTGSDDAIVTLTDSVISNNFADFDNSNSGDGGGIYNRGTSSLNNSTVSGNDANDSGGILNDGGTATIIQSTISGNTAISAAGIRNQSNGTLNMVNSTVSGNIASPGGAGGIANNVGTGTVANTLVQLSNVTIANNTAVSGTGGGINNSATVNMKNSIVANNSASANPDCKGTIVSGGYNLIESTSGCTITGTTTGNITGQDPNLTVLNFNFGTTKTHALIFPSPAIDAGNPGGCTDHNNILLVGDQRNFVRHVDGDGNASALCDMGSYERLAFATITPTPTLTHTPTKTHTPTRTPTPIQLVATGIVWLDANRDGIRGGGELALSNVNVEMWDGAKTQLLQSDTTDANGAYQVQGPAGNLRVRVILPNDFTFSPLNQGGNDSVDSDIFPNGQDFGFSSVLATSGATVLDAGMYTGVTPTPFNSATPTQTFTRTQTPTKTNTVPPGSTSTFTPTPTNTPTTTNNCTAKPSKPILKKPGNNAQVATTRPQLKWNAANCADTYNVTIKDAATNKKADGKKNLTALKYKTKELAANKIFKWFVQACNSFGCTKSSTRTFTTP